MHRRKKSVETGVQYPAPPYRGNVGARTEVMLMTSRETRRWIIPKGWPHKGRTPHRSAAPEAYEEAGVVGRVQRDPLGSFSYQKPPDRARCRCSRSKWATEPRMVRKARTGSQVAVFRAGRKSRPGTDAGEDHSTVSTRSRHHTGTVRCPNLTIMASPISGEAVSGKNLLLRNKIAGEYIDGLTTSAQTPVIRASGGRRPYIAHGGPDFAVPCGQWPVGSTS
jgi:hypothetical protein